MMIGASATNSPKRARRKRCPWSGEPFPPRPSSPPPEIGGCTAPPPWPALGSLIVIVGDNVAIPVLVRRDSHGISLHDVIPRRSGNAVLVRPMINYRRASAKVVVWRRRRRGPLQRSSFPGVVASLRTLLQTPEQIDHEN